MKKNKINKKFFPFALMVVASFSVLGVISAFTFSCLAQEKTSVNPQRLLSAVVTRVKSVTPVTKNTLRILPDPTTVPDDKPRILPIPTGPISYPIPSYPVSYPISYPISYPVSYPTSYPISYTVKDTKTR